MSKNQLSPRRQPDSPLLATAIVPSVERVDQSPRATGAEFDGLIADGARWRVAGSAKRNPLELLTDGYAPKHKLELFGTRFYLTNVRQNPELRFFVAYVVQAAGGRSSSKLEVAPRIFYKDLSLVWRSASHFADLGGLWIGKGDVETVVSGGYEQQVSREATTDLPLEIQSALESLLGWTKKPQTDEEVIGRVLRKAGPERIAPYADFTRPRRKAAANPANRIFGNRRIARFTRKNDPSSLIFARGFEPDFADGILEETTTRSRLYGGVLRRFRILSTNRRIQYGFIAGPKQVWIIPPQATITQLSSYGVRTVDVYADDDLFLPGYEYHFIVDGEDTESGEPELYSQIPPGFAGATCEFDEDKADASPWLDKLPVIQQFRKQVLRSSKGK